MPRPAGRRGSGYAYASFDTSSELSLAGAPAPGAAVTVDDQGIFMGDVGFDITDHWTARRPSVRRSHCPCWRAGRCRDCHRRLPEHWVRSRSRRSSSRCCTRRVNTGASSPISGAGAAYTYILRHDSRETLRSSRRAAGGAPCCRRAATSPSRPQLSAFADARKVYFATTASGVVPALGGVPVEAAVTLDPLLFNVGVGYRF